MKPVYFREVAICDPVLSIIVISYNTREMTLACLRSVVAETTTPFELLVVDNASSDGSAEAISAEFPEITLLAETENHGFAKANNIAAQRARGEYILLLNPDTLVLEGALDRLCDFARETPSAGIWGGRTVYGDHSPNPASAWGKMTLWNIFCRTSGLTGIFSGSGVFNSEAYGNWDRMSRREVDIVTGCLLLIRRTDWEQLGGFDLTFVMYGEESDLCLRATRDLGHRPSVTPDAVIVHYGGASETVASDRMVRILRAKAELIARHFPAWQVPLARRLFAAWPWTRALVLKLLGTLSGRKAWQEKAAIWSEIWHRRAEWQRGF